MNELKVNGSQEFMGIDIPIIEGGFGEDKKCISDKTISIIHNTSNPEVRRLIKDNIKRFTESIDFIDLKQRVGDTHTLELLQVLGYAKQSITQAEHIYLLSERGYAKLIKIMDTDIAWETHDKLIDEYFVLRKQVSIMLSEEDKYILKLYHADTKEEMLMIAKQHEQEIVQPLRDSVDRYERFLCEKTGMLTKTDLATKLDTKTQTLAARLKKVGVYTKTSQISGDFLKKYPDTKIVIECDNTYTDTNGNEQKILEEETGKVYKLMNMTDNEFNSLDNEDGWKTYLSGDGLKQTYEYWDDGSYNIKTKVFNIKSGQKPYYVGYVGQH